METIRSVIDLLLAINCLLLSIGQHRLHKRIKVLSDNVVYLSFKDMSRDEKEVIKNDKGRNQE